MKQDIAYGTALIALAITLLPMQVPEALSWILSILLGVCGIYIIYPHIRNIFR